MGRGSSGSFGGDGRIVPVASNEAAASGLLVDLLLVAAGITRAGLFIVNPNQADRVQILNRYVGTAKQREFWWNSLPVPDGVVLVPELDTANGDAGGVLAFDCVVDRVPLCGDYCRPENS